MAFDQKELEEQLIQAGNKLADPPSSVDELLSLLNVISLSFHSFFNIVIFSFFYSGYDIYI